MVLAARQQPLTTSAGQLCTQTPVLAQCSLQLRASLLLAGLGVVWQAWQSQIQLASWPDDILQADGAYTEGCDILVLGHMLSSLNAVTSPEGCGFLQRMWPAVPDQAVPTAEDLLRDAWIKCSGDLCTTAGAQPNSCCAQVPFV